MKSDARDAARFRWLVAHPGAVTFNPDSDNHRLWTPIGTETYADTFRSAVDMAMRIWRKFDKENP